MALHHVLEAEEHRAIPIFMIAAWPVRIGMVGIAELHDVESAVVHIEMDAPCLEVGRHQASDPDIGMHLLDGAPGGIQMPSMKDPLRATEPEGRAESFWITSLWSSSLWVETFSGHAEDHRKRSFDPVRIREAGSQCSGNDAEGGKWGTGIQMQHAGIWMVLIERRDSNEQTRRGLGWKPAQEGQHFGIGRSLLEGREGGWQRGHRILLGLDGHPWMQGMLWWP